MSELNENRGLWGAVWAGLVDDPGGKHVKRMRSAVWLYLYLIIHANWDTGRLVRAFQTISNDMGTPTRTLKGWMSVLKKFKYVEIVRNPHSLSIQITKWESIKRKMRSAETRIEKCELTYREVQNPASSARTRTSVNDSKIKDKCKRSAEPRTSNEILNESNNKRESHSLAKNSKSAKKKSKSTPDIHQAIAHYKSEFQLIHSIEILEINGPECKVFQRLLKTRPIEKVNSLITGYLSLKDPKLREAGFPIIWLPNHVTGLLMAENKPERELAY